MYLIRNEIGPAATTGSNSVGDNDENDGNDAAACRQQCRKKRQWT